MAGGFLGNWRLNLLGEWRKGQSFIWAGGGGSFPELDNNVRWKDYYNLDLRFTKHFNTNFGNAQFFVDFSNVLNIRHMYRQAAFHQDNFDYEYYMWSLHLPEDIYDGLRDQSNLPYIWIPGNDQPGDFRHPSVAFQPIEAVANLEWCERSPIISHGTGLRRRATPTAAGMALPGKMYRVVN